MLRSVKVLTVEEVNHKINKIKRIIDKIRETKSKLNFFHAGLPPNKMKEVTRRSSINAASAERQVRFSNAIKELIAEGGLLKDEEEGLVDFRWRKKGKNVYLCWKYGEDSVTHWHSLTGGCSKRKKI